MIQEMIFLLLAGGAFGFAVLAVTLKNIFHAALSFAAALFGIAGIFIFLEAEFLAMVQILVYVGAIAVLIIFAIMISPPSLLKGEKKPISKFFFCFCASASLFAVLSVLLFKSFPMQLAETGRDFSLEHLGVLLLTKYVLPFEVIALVLLLAIVGAIIHAWEGVGKNE